MAIFVLKPRTPLFPILLIFALSGPATAGEPFGRGTELAAGPLWLSWQNLQNEISGDRRIIARCRANPAECDSPAATQFLEIVDEAAQLQGRTRIAHINRAFNLAIRWMSDTQQYGVAEIWKAPLASLASGAGDCTDFAIAKYVALNETGIALDDLRIVFGRIETKQQDHAVLAARESGHWLVLDNRTMGLVEDAEFENFQPLIELDQRGVRLFVQPRPVELTRARCMKAAG